MSGEAEYTPPRIWTWDTASGGKFANINRTDRGLHARQGSTLGPPPPPFTLSLGTPNG
jgi:GST-like protein